MQFKDEGVLVLKAQTDLDKRLDDIHKKAKDLKTTLKEIEKNDGKGSAEWKKYKEELTATEAAAKKLAKEIKTMDVSRLTIQQLQNHAKDLAKEMKNADRNSQEYVKNAKRLGEVERELAKAKKQANELKGAGEDLAKPTLWNKISTGIKGIGTAFQAIFALQIIGWMVDVGKSIFNTTAELESQEATLSNLLGSQKDAKGAMLAIKEEAKNTAFTVNDLTKGYIKLIATGIQPSKAEMRNFADIAALNNQSFEELTEAIKDGTTGEFETLKKFLISAKKDGDNLAFSFKGQTNEVKKVGNEYQVLDKTTNKTIATFNTQAEAVSKAIAKFGELTGVAGLNEQKMKTLTGVASNLEDSFQDLVGFIGQKLKPVFIFLLSLLSQGVSWLKAVFQASDPLLKVFEDLFVAVGDIIDVFTQIIKDIFPSTINGGNILSGVMKGIAFAVRLGLLPLQAFAASLRLVYDAISGLINGGKSLVQFLKGDFTGAAKSFEASKQNFTNLKNNAVDSFEKIKKGFIDTFADAPAKAIEKGVLPAGRAEKSRQNELTKEQKKGIEDRKKAQEEALKKIDELENEAAIEHIRRTQGEVAADKAALQQKFELEKAAIEKSLAAQEQKDKQLKLLKAKLDREIEQLETKHQQVVADILEKWVNNEYDTKTKKANDYAKKELEDARKAINDKQKLAEVERKINDWLKNELAKIEEEKRNKSIEEAEKATKKELEFATKQLNAEKFIMDQKHKAEMALYDGLELAARDNKSKLLQLQKERLDTELRQLKEKLAIEQKAEELKLRQDIKDEAERNAALTKINDAYRAREVEETKKTEQAKTELERKATEEKKRIREGLSSAFEALLKGDFVAFANHLDSVVQREKTAMQQRIDGNMATYQMIAQMAVQAVNFLNELTQKRIQKDLEALSAEYQQKKAMLEKSLNDERTAVEQAEAAVNNLKEQYSDQITKTIDDNENFINQMKQFYNDAQSADSAEKYAEQVNLANSEADEKIRNANRAMEHAQAAARAERDERIVAAEAAKNAEIAAILQRADIDMATKNTLINAATAKANLEIELAKSEADAKIKLSEEEKAAKIKAAQEEKDQKIELLTALKTATKEQADELLKKAKDDAKAKVEAAEKEKIDKLKILEDEKQKRIVAKKELEKKLLEEEKAAKNKEAKLKYDAAMSQWRADQTTALIQGALAAIKAFAVGGPILGFVFAALTAVATGIQIAAIRKNKPQPPAQYATGGMAPLAGIGGLPKGPRHGKKYGDSGLAIVNRQTGVEEGEMEGGEAIISKEQTDANLPIIQQMWSKARKGDRTPVVPMSSRPMAFAYGGIMPSLGGREMFLFGSRKRKAAEAEAAAEAESADTAAAQEAQAKAQENMDKMLETLEAIKEEMTMLNEKTDKLVDGSTQEVSATREVAQAVRDSNANGKLDGVIAAISSWGKK